MPRIAHSTLLKAYKKSSLLPLILQGSRTLQPAVNELRWLREHVEEVIPKRYLHLQDRRLLQLCRRRSRGEPLQYILGSQPFGELDIKCRPGVLIPRPETETYTTYLAQLITSHRLDDVFDNKFLPGGEVLSSPRKTKAPPLKILDLCTGSGCIPLLLNCLVSKTHKYLQIHAWDVSPVAISLAKDNWMHNVKLGHLTESAHSRVHFDIVDIFDRTSKLKCILSSNTMENPGVDIIISNPPYISRTAFRKETTRSVRNWEPKLALVPRNVPKEEWPKDVDLADLFYHRLLTLHHHTFKAKVLVMEVGDEAQALRVAKMAADHCGKSNHIEIWRDNPDLNSVENRQIGDCRIALRGTGSFRVVALFRLRHESKPRSKASQRMDTI